MGGTDQQNFTEKALRNCLKNLDAASIDIVVGSFYPYTKNIKKIATQQNKKIRLHSNLTEKEICLLMKRSTIGICSASTISYEYATIGGLLFVYQTVPNQKNIYSFLIKSHIAFPATTLSSTVQTYTDLKKRKKYVENRRTYFDGKSGKNIRSIFDKLELERGIQLRAATQHDVLTYFKWVNDPAVRENSIETAPIPLENHYNWFSARLKNKHSTLYIFEKNKKPVGQVRFDSIQQKAAIDYSIDPAYRGKGLGEIILKMALLKYTGSHPGVAIEATVKASNEASNRVFLNLHFKRMKPAVRGKMTYENYLLKV
jgi:UDP-2,4-diacetamido-2,4,6-trideoxy-beta-L-altropyranose hydrolase